MLRDNITRDFSIETSAKNKTNNALYCFSRKFLLFHSFLFFMPFCVIVKNWWIRTCFSSNLNRSIFLFCFFFVFEKALFNTKRNIDLFTKLGLVIRSRFRTWKKEKSIFKYLLEIRLESFGHYCKYLRYFKKSLSNPFIFLQYFKVTPLLWYPPTFQWFVKSLISSSIFHERFNPITELSFMIKSELLSSIGKI